LKEFKEKTSLIPKPLAQEMFKILRKGVYNNKDCEVFINEQEDFAFLYPYVEYDYSAYVPRVQKLNQTIYKKKRAVFEQRFSKIKSFLQNNISSIIEIGAAEGKFLSIVKEAYPNIALAAVEPDANTLKEREDIADLSNYISIEEASSSGTYDIVCLFHVFEHIFDIESFFCRLKKLMHKDSILIIEVPSLDDPLLSVYNLREYEDFYFQVQHPFVYSRDSLERVIEYNGFKTKSIIDFQRYGLENHLQWLASLKPGGNPFFENIFERSAQTYRNDLECAHKTDSVIWSGTMMKDGE